MMETDEQRDYESIEQCAGMGGSLEKKEGDMDKA
jgi:hypothetical protein